MIPNEGENRIELQKMLLEVWPAAIGLVEIGLETLERLGKCTAEQLPFKARLAMSGLMAQEIRKYRSVLLLTEFGLDEAAAMTTRSMFEGLLAERFILKKPRKTSACPPQLQGQIRKLPPIPTNRKAVEFRAELYAVCHLLRLPKAWERAKKVKELRRTVTKKRMLALSKREAEVR